MGGPFLADLWAHGDEPGSWHFVTLPVDVADEIREEAGPRRGFGSIRVRVRLGTTTWRTSLFPDAASGSMVLPVRKGVRVAEGVEAGDVCELEVELSPDEVRTARARASPARGRPPRRGRPR